VRVLGTAIGNVAPRTERISVGRHGASDATAFIDAGVPAVEFGPVGDGHHGPEEWVSIRSLGQYREALVQFVRLLPEQLSEDVRRLRIA
jgi:succinyl-diaminopimelate desuccinylase